MAKQDTLILTNTQIHTKVFFSSLQNFTYVRIKVNFGNKLCMHRLQEFIFGTSSVWGRIGFLRIFTLAFLLFLVPAGDSNPAGPLSNPAGQSFTLT